MTLAAPGTLEGDALARDIAGYERDYHQKVGAGQANVNPLYLLNLGKNAQNVGNVAYYNARDNRIEIRDITIQGGFIQLYGDIINTGSGTLEALDGYGRIKIDNRSGYELVVNNLNAGQEIEGQIKIIDTAGTTTKTTVYRMLGDDVVVEDGNGAEISRATNQSATTYQTLAGQRYSWVTGQAIKNIEVRTKSVNSLDLWLFKIDALIADSESWNKTRYSTTPITLEKGAYYSLVAPSTGFQYSYDYSSVDLLNLDGGGQLATGRRRASGRHHPEGCQSLSVGYHHVAVAGFRRLRAWGLDTVLALCADPLLVFRSGHGTGDQGHTYAHHRRRPRDQYPFQRLRYGKDRYPFQ